MKKLYNILLLSVIAAITLLWGACKSDDESGPSQPPQLPAITAEGKNTMGCMINGKIFAVPYGLSFIQGEYYYRKVTPDLYGVFEIKGENGINSADEKFVGITMGREVYTTGYYPVQYADSSSGIRRAFFTTFDGVTGTSYICKSNMYGWLNIALLDTVKHIASGTFEFDAVNLNDVTDTVKIREGRFDAKFIY